MPAGGFTISAEVRMRSTNLGSTVSQIQKGLRGIKVDLDFKIPKGASSQINQLRNNLQGGKTAAEDFGEAVGVAAKKFTAFSLAAGAIITAVGAIKQGISAAIDFQHEMVRLEQVGGATSGAIREISDEITRLSKTFGTSSKDLSQVATTLRQAG